MKLPHAKIARILKGVRASSPLLLWTKSPADKGLSALPAWAVQLFSAAIGSRC